MSLTSILIIIGFFAIMIIGIFLKDSDKIKLEKNYKSRINSLKEDPADPNIRSQCYENGRLHYKDKYKKHTVLEIEALINSDIEAAIGHLKFPQKKEENNKFPRFDGSFAAERTSFVNK